GSVDVTVGFLPGITVADNTPSPTPASPSTADTLSFGVSNPGNGTDSVTIAENISVAGIMTVTGYRYSGTTYATLTDLNTALSIVSVNGVAGDSTRVTLAPTSGQQITVVYNVADIVGATDSLFLKARSVGNPTASDQDYYDLVVVKPNLTLAKAAIYDATSLP